MNSFQRCPGCFEETHKYGHCQECGNNTTYHNNDIYLQSGIKLQGRYVLGKVCVNWGWSIEYLGWDEQLNIKVVIHEFIINGWVTRVDGIIQVAPDKQEQFAKGVKQFLDEVGNYAKSKYQGHPNFLTLSDYFEANGTAYSINIYESGIRLKQHLDNQLHGKMPWREALPIVIQIIDAICTLHEKNLLHLDICPDNILLTDEARVILMGLSNVEHLDAEKSQCFDLVLRPGYSPLEQYSRNSKGPWTEVYALGATLYEMLTGKSPPDAIDRYENKDKLMSLSPIALNAPIKLTDIIHKALSLKPEARFQTVEEMQQALLEVLKTESELDQQITGKLRQSINAIKSLKIASLWQNKK